MHGRYPDFDVLAEADHWDEATRRAVLARLNPPALRFFDEVQARSLNAFCDTVLAQDREPRVPVLAFVDAKLHDGRLDGFQYADMPADRETWRLVARGLDEAASEHDASSYGDADDGDPARGLPGVRGGRAVGRRLGWAAGGPRVGGRDAGGARRLLLAPVGVERDRVRWARLPARLHAPWCRPE
jgi:hypothetical protein